MIQTHIMDDRFFNEVVVRDEVSKLRALLRAIPKWEEVAVAEVDALAAIDLGEMSEEQRHWHGENVNDSYYSIDVTKDALFGGLAVNAASTVENIMRMLCNEYKVALRERANWCHMEQGLARLIGGVRLSDVPGFDSADRSRILANCFKHNGGTVNQEYIDKIAPRPLDEVIRYRDENWGATFNGIQKALLALVQRLPARPWTPRALDVRNLFR